MDLTRIEEAVRDSKGRIAEKKEVVVATLASPDENNVRSSIDSGRALQLFLDHVLISSIQEFVTFNSCPGLKSESDFYCILLFPPKYVIRLDFFFFFCFFPNNKFSLSGILCFFVDIFFAALECE